MSLSHPTPPRGGEESLQQILDRLSGPAARVRPTAPAPPPAPRPAALPPARPRIAAGPRPWLSASASIFVWGGGQWWNGQRRLAILFLLSQGLAAAVAWCIHETWGSCVRLGSLFSIDEPTLQAAVAAAGLLIPTLAILTVLQAYFHADRQPGARRPGQLRLLPGLASALVPGWGQIFNCQPGKAIGFLSGWWFAIYVVLLSRLGPSLWARIDPSGVPLSGVQLSVGVMVAVLVAGLSWSLAIYDAESTRRRRARGRLSRP